MKTATASVPQTFGDLMTEFDTIIKQAEAKAAGLNDPETTHPVDSAPDGTQQAGTGSQASHLDKEVPSQIGETSVNSTPEAKPEERQPRPEGGQNVTGPDEKPPEGQPKGHPDDPGTSHPASGDAGEKYSSFDDVIRAGNSLLRDIAALKIEPQTVKAAEVQPVATAPAAAPASPAAPAAPVAPITKEASSNPTAPVTAPTATAVSADTVIQEAIKRATEDAGILCHFMENFVKGAAGEDAMMGMGGGAPPPPPMDPAAAAGGAPPAGLDSPGGMGGDQKQQAIEAIGQIMATTNLTIEELVAALSGGAGGAAPPPPPDAGGGGNAVPPPGTSGEGSSSESSDKSAADKELQLLKNAQVGLVALAELGKRRAEVAAAAAAKK